MRLNARAPIIIRGDEITHLDADGYKHLPRAASLPDGKILASSGGAWRPSDLSGVSVSSVFGRTGAVAAQTGDYTAEQVGALAVALKGTANGVAELDAMGRVPSGQLPSYVDDVIEVANFAALPGTGEAGKIYITLDNNKTWRWSGSGYAEISASLALGETSSTAYRGDRGATAYAHSQATGNPHWTTPDDIGAFAKTCVLGGINFHNFETPGVYEIRGNSWANGWAGLTGTQGVALLQMRDIDGRRFLLAGDGKYGGLMLKFQASEIPGDHWSPWFQVWDSGSLPAGTVGRSVLAATTAAAGRTAIDAAKKPSKIDVSASANLGSIDASAIKVTATDVTLTCSGGFDGQGWDIIGSYAIGIGVPSGVTLYRFAGVTVGPATYAPGGGRALRVVRVDASTWIMPNLS